MSFLVASRRSRDMAGPPPQLPGAGEGGSALPLGVQPQRRGQQLPRPCPVSRGSEPVRPRPAWPGEAARRSSPVETGWFGTR